MHVEAGDKTGQGAGNPRENHQVVQGQCADQHRENHCRCLDRFHQGIARIGKSHAAAQRRYAEGTHGTHASRLCWREDTKVNAADHQSKEQQYGPCAAQRTHFFKRRRAFAGRPHFGIDAG